MIQVCSWVPLAPLRVLRESGYTTSGTARARRVGGARFSRASGSCLLMGSAAGYCTAEAPRAAALRPRNMSTTTATTRYTRNA